MVKASEMKETFHGVMASAKENIVQFAKQFPPCCRNEATVNDLQNALEGGDPEATNFYAELEDVGTSCTFHVSARRTDSRVTVDDQGNEWEYLKIEVSLNWPCHGQTDALTALARIRFYQKCAEMASDLQARMGKTYTHCYRTKAEVEYSQRAQLRRTSEQAVKIHAAAWSKGMKILERNVHTVEGILPGSYEVDIQKRSYRIVVNDSATSASITRMR